MERTQRRWSRKIYIRPAVATRPIPNGRPWPWSSASPRSSRRRWNHRRNEPSVITIGSERRSPDAAILSLPPFLLFLVLFLSLSLYLTILPSLSISDFTRLLTKWILVTFTWLSYFHCFAKGFLSRRDFETENRYVEYWIAGPIASEMLRIRVSTSLERDTGETIDFNFDKSEKGAIKHFLFGSRIWRKSYWLFYCSWRDTRLVISCPIHNDLLPLQ